MDYSVLPQKWQDRFKFFDEHGGPTTPEYKAALKQLDFKERIKISMNIISFFLGFFHFFFLGLWRKNLVIFAAAIPFGIINVISPLLLPIGLANLLSLVFNLVFMIAYSCIANYAYYLHVVKKSTSWNPLEGIFTPNSSESDSSSKIVS